MSNDKRELVRQWLLNDEYYYSTAISCRRGARDRHDAATRFVESLHDTKIPYSNAHFTVPSVADVIMTL